MKAYPKEESEEIQDPSKVRGFGAVMHNSQARLDLRLGLVNAELTIGIILEKPSMSKVKSLCQNLEKNVLDNRNDLDFNIQTEHHNKLKSDTEQFRWVYSNISFEKTKGTKKLERKAQAYLITPSHFDWAAPGNLVPNKDETNNLIADYRGLNKHLYRSIFVFSKK